MSFSDKTKAALNEPLHPDHIRPAKQYGPKGDYIEGWHAKAEANRIFGFDGWNSETIRLECVCERERPVGKDQKPGWSVTYIAKVRITAHGVVKEGCGSGHGIGVDPGECHESALKEAETDAQKRAFTNFGNPFGLALYDKSRANVGAPSPEPDSAVGPEALATTLRYIEQCRETILKFPDRKAAGEWWNAGAQKRARQQFGLSDSDKQGLIGLINRKPVGEGESVP